LKLSGILCALLGVFSLVFSQTTLAQVQPATGEWRILQPTTWAVFGGGSYARNSATGASAAGWSAGVSENPYPSRPWVGGTIEASGHYDTPAAGDKEQVHTVMGGPNFTLTRSRVQPFARVLFGAVLTKETAGSLTVLSHYFGTAAGGGADLPISERCAIRGQADWVSFLKPTGRINLLRASGGLVFRF
jgi:hypothetical protein